MSKRSVTRATRVRALAASIALAGCGAGAATPDLVNGWDSYGRADHIACGARPVFLKGWHMDLTMDGPCRTVIVAGSHNDIVISLVPGGSIEITGAHNDVSWRLPPGIQGAPILLDHGPSNTFHAGG